MPQAWTLQHDIDALDGAATYGEVINKKFPACVVELKRCNADKARIQEWGRE